MANTIYAGRASGTIFAGRASPTIMAGATTPPGYAPAMSTIPFAPFNLLNTRGGLCQPIPQCCCKGPINIAPGDTEVIPMNWARWLDSNQYALYAVDEAHLYDMSESPPVPADPAIIKVTKGIGGGDPDPVDNGDVADLVKLMPPYGTNVLVTVSKDARIGSQYKLTVCIQACNGCDPGKVRQCDCIVITVAEC